MNLMKYKVWYFVFSILIIIPGVYVLLTSGLRLGIDFTGGGLLEYQFEKSVNKEDLINEFHKNNIELSQIAEAENNIYILRIKPIESDKLIQLKQSLTGEFGKFEERRQEVVGPTIGGETTRKAGIALVVASVAIVLYIAFSFRKVPKPTSSFRFGVAAVIALIHDVLLIIGVFAILGKFLQVEVDALFVTALLTIIGFSVHDTIVVFDRIRENLIKNPGGKFINTANRSIVQTLGRSLNTSLTVVFVLTALLLFGGESIKWFTVALLVGIISGTYSSIFNATALLVWWEEKLGH